MPQSRDPLPYPPHSLKDAQLILERALQHLGPGRADRSGAASLSENRELLQNAVDSPNVTHDYS
jgi:hypothetical protein